MERITLYYRGCPVSHHRLYKEEFSVGSAPGSDLVLASGVAEERWVIRRTKSGKWTAEQPERPRQAAPPVLENGVRIGVGPFEFSLESEEAAAVRLRDKAPSKLELRLRELGWAGHSAVMHQLRSRTELLAPLLAPVLITGESGTGKELVARGLHLLSRRKDGPFVPVNCGGFTETLLEDTLFGHERGAFTGAATKRRGVFEQAHGGTLFLDEIGDLPLTSQASLLRVLDEKRISRIGSEQSGPVDFRLVAATHRDLKSMVRKNKFRLDLFHRISTLHIETFALRDHLEDIRDIAAQFFLHTEAELGPRRLDASALEKAAAYKWPGNVRELRNVLYRSAAVCRKSTIGAEDLDIPAVPERRKTPVRLYKLSSQHLVDVVTDHDGNIAAAARALGVPRTSLRDRIKAEHPELLQCMDLTG